MSKFSENLRAMREQTFLLQSDIAQKLSVTTQAYGSYERGDREPRFDTLCLLADIFHTSVDKLLGREVSRMHSLDLGYNELKKYCADHGCEVDDESEKERVIVKFHSLTMPTKPLLSLNVAKATFIDTIQTAIAQADDSEHRRREEALSHFLETLAVYKNCLAEISASGGSK